MLHEVLLYKRHLMLAHLFVMQMHRVDDQYLVFTVRVFHGLQQVIFKKLNKWTVFSIFYLETKF